MSNEFSLNIESRSDLGKGASRRLRRLEDKVPGILYGAEKEPTSIAMLSKDINKAVENEAFYSHVLTLNLDGTEEKAVLKDLQRHPAKARILHADFLRVDKKQKLTVRAPLHFINEDNCVGVKMQGGAISHSMTELEISCLPGDLPEYIEVDMAEVEIDQIVHISDIELPKGVESVALSHGEDHDLPVAAIHKPKAVVEDEPVAEAEATDAEADTTPEEGEGDSE